MRPSASVWPYHSPQVALPGVGIAVTRDISADKEELCNNALMSKAAFSEIVRPPFEVRYPLPVSITLDRFPVSILKESR